MLTLSRREGETLLFTITQNGGPPIEVALIVSERPCGGAVKFSIQAPPEVRIIRGEIAGDSPLLASIRKCFLRKHPQRSFAP